MPVEMFGVGVAIAQLLLRSAELLRSSDPSGDVAAGVVGDASVLVRSFRPGQDPVGRKIANELAARLQRPHDPAQEHEFQAAADSVADLISGLARSDAAILAACRRPHEFVQYLMAHGGREKRARVAEVAEPFFDNVLAAAAAEFVRLAPRSDLLPSAGIVGILDRLDDVSVDSRRTADGVDSLVARIDPEKVEAARGAARRHRLERMKDAGHRRVADSLRAIGLNDAEADELAVRILSAAPSIAPERDLTVVTGLMGVGKTTELERLHRQAVEKALTDSGAPIPLFLRASELDGTSIRRAVPECTGDLGDPTKAGVHLIVDGLDEAGIEVRQLSSSISTLLVEWPGSKVLLGIRTQRDELGRETVELPPLSWESASELIALVYPDFKPWGSGRPEFAELLCRPMYAISHGLDLRRGIAGSAREAELIDSIGRRAVDELGGGAEAFGLLVRLSESVVSAGGQPIEIRSLEASPPQLRQLAQSRIVHVTDGRITFQLAVLTEWFAAQGVLSDPQVLHESTKGPVQSHRWRYALAQALMQASAAQADNIMDTLLARAPATAAWVRHQAEAPRSRARTVPPAPTAIEAGTRVRRAATAWVTPWPQLLKERTVDGELPTLGVRMEGTYLVTAWHRQHPPTTDPVVPLPPHVHPLGQRDPDWTGEHSGRPNDGALWPWDWAFQQVRSSVENAITGGRLLANVETCWPELAWQYAHRIVKRYATVSSAPVARSAIEAKIAEIRRQFPEGDCLVAGGREWRLCEAEAFVADLASQGIEEVAPPWPAADTQGEWTWLWWSTDQLLRRLHLVTRAALDVYQQIVEVHLPSMAPELSTYQLLPASFVGTVAIVDANPGHTFEPGLQWHLEPLPDGSPNQSHWQLAEGSLTRHGPADWEEWRAKAKSLRGDIAECTELTWHGGLSDIYSSTPAGAIALDLLNDDLKRFHWSTANRIDLDSTGTRPVYR